MRFAALYAQQNWLQNVGNGILNFGPKNFLEPSKVKIFFSKIFLTLGGFEKFWGQKFKIPFQNTEAMNLNF